ncbi:type III ribulose-bisphosphate carboxylase [Candidatus Woesearchaeota archaeon]|nr:MAG: type III ribulose-bisphosphate carboxylase [Candidatus Woesearchaeota archaeon]
MSAYANRAYIDKNYKPSRNDVVVEYYMEPYRVQFWKAAVYVAAESSIGTWTTIKTMNPKIAKKLRPTIFYMDSKKNIIKIAYPHELFEAGNMPQIFSSIGGNVFGMKSVKNLRLEDVSYPKVIIDKFKGPRFGIEGIRKLTKVYRRPLLGTIVKPKVGLDEKQHAKIAYNAWVGGLDIVKDDENLSSMSFNKFKKRIELTLKMRDRAEKETGEKKIYMPNITAETIEMVRRAAHVKMNGGEYIMIDILTAGWAGLQTMRERNDKQFIHAHRAGHAALTRNEKHGISMAVLADAARLIGVDQLHIGTAAIGKMHGSKEEELALLKDIEYKKIFANPKLHVLEQRWYNIKPVMAVASGGLHPGMVPKLIRTMSKNIVIQMGGGVTGHPDGTLAGAKAVRQAVEAYYAKEGYDVYKKKYPELYKAIKKWGRG